MHGKRQQRGQGAWPILREERTLGAAIMGFEIVKPLKTNSGGHFDAADRCRLPKFMATAFLY
jgi:hypothetical protein